MGDEARRRDERDRDLGALQLLGKLALVVAVESAVVVDAVVGAPFVVIEGDTDRRKLTWSMPGVPVLIANYESLVRDRACLTAIEEPFDLAVIDESQRIKNSSGTTNEVVCSIPRKRSWALTGTPIENSVDDLVGRQHVALGVNDVTPGGVDR